MKRITLYSPAERNGGDYVDAGATLTVGDGADEISAARAKALTDGGRAATATSQGSAGQSDTDAG